MKTLLKTITQRNSKPKKITNKTRKPRKLKRQKQTKKIRDKVGKVTNTKISRINQEKRKEQF